MLWCCNYWKHMIVLILVSSHTKLHASICDRCLRRCTMDGIQSHSPYLKQLTASLLGQPNKCLYLPPHAKALTDLLTPLLLS